MVQCHGMTHAMSTYGTSIVHIIDRARWPAGAITASWRHPFTTGDHETVATIRSPAMGMVSSLLEAMLES